ncbi:hypothetical protein EYZ11_005689 [Aspergillus tanneri]|uniref:Uncharacterized protein n=1 Tax=Aspergillus tanneri TaxID=1220188 RepID=A0A4S3JJN1_9EURO|nr:hypothetical protein EYZ11_005689 [Aspergillus tanneri]
MSEQEHVHVFLLVLIVNPGLT